MCILNIARVVKKMSDNERRDLIFENYCKRTGFSKENSHYSMKYLEKKIYCRLQTN